MKTTETVRKRTPWLRSAIIFSVFLLAVVGVEVALEWLPAEHAVAGGLAPLRSALIALTVFAGAHLVYVLFAAHFARRGKGKRRVPRVLMDLLRVVLFVLATLISLSLFFYRDMSGILAGSGLVLAMLGFAIRNVVADTLSGMALGLEAPFRMGDWVRIETLAQGRVQEIGWRTTRLVTRDSTYVILPNSQISRQRITNFSAPRKEYRDHVQLVLPISLPVEEAKELIMQALESAESIIPDKEPAVQVVQYGLHGVTYQVKYWVPQYDREPQCRNELFSLIDAALREKGIPLAQEQSVLFCPMQEGAGGVAPSAT